MLDGELTLVTDAGEQVLRAGMAAGFPAGTPDGHHLINRTDRPATYLEVGTRREDVDEVDYPDIDMAVRHQDGQPDVRPQERRALWTGHAGLPNIAGQALSRSSAAFPPSRGRGWVTARASLSPASTYSAAAATTTMRVPKVIASRVAELPRAPRRSR